MSAVGKGIFSLPEVSRYTRVPLPTIRRWFTGESPLFRPQLPAEGRWKAVSFHNMVEVLVADSLKQCGLSTQLIRKAADLLRNELETDTPFCRKDLCTDGRNLFIRIAQKNEISELYEIFSQQRQIPRVLNEHLKTVKYDDVTNLATKWCVTPGITIDPAVCFGRPVIAGTRIPAQTIYDAWIVEDRDNDRVSELYSVKSVDIKAAVKFYTEYYKAA